MSCPLCEKELNPNFRIDPKSGNVIFFESCPTIIRLTRTHRDVSYVHDVSHYQLYDNAEIAYVTPYRIHNVLDEKYCEVSICPLHLDFVYEGYSEKSGVIFKSSVIQMTTEKKLRERIKTLVLFS